MQMILVGAAMLSEIHQLIRAEGVIIRLAGVKPPVVGAPDRRGLELIGSDHGRSVAPADRHAFHTGHRGSC